MLPEFRSQIFQLPLVATTWINARNRYTQERKTSAFPIRFILSIIEQTVSLIHGNIIRPLLNPYHSYLNNLDPFLCSYIDSIRHICPIVDQTSDEIIERYGDLFIFSFFNKTSVDNNSNHVINNRKERKIRCIEKYFQFLTNILIIIEMYSKYIQNELNDYIDTSRNLWKNLNMEDGRSLDEVESFSEKLLVLGRRMTGNYRQFVYLIRYQFKRCRYILFSVVHVQHRFRSTVWRITQKVQINRINQILNDHARYGLMTSKERVRYYLEMIMIYAAKHPWMRWTLPRSNQLSQSQVRRPLESTRPIFFVSSNNTSECSEVDDNLRNRSSKIFESTPYRKNHQRSNIIQIEDVLSDISSSSASVPEQSFDVKDILRQVGAQSRRASDTSSLRDQEDENRVIEEALNQSDENQQQQQQQQPVSIFDLSPMLASGCAV